MIESNNMSRQQELHSLPKGWVWTRLKEIAEIIPGQSPPSSTYNESENGLPFYQGKIEFGNMYPTPRKWCSAPKKIAERGDVLISVRAPVGSTNICPSKSCIGRGLAAVRSLGSIQTIFILYLMRTFEDILSRKGTGTTFNAITGDRLKNFEIPLPPLPEQHRIVAKIEEVFSNLDVGVEALKKIKEQLKRYRQAVLKYAFEGKLTADWRQRVLNDELRIPNEKDNLSKFKIDNSDLPELPKGGLWIKFENILEKVEKVNPKSEPNKQFIYLDIASIDNSLKKITSPKKYFGIEAPSRARQLVKSGDILFSTVRTYLKNIAFVDEKYHNQIASTGFCVIRPKEKINKKYIFYLVQTDSFLNPLNEIQRGTSYPAVRNSDVFSQIVPILQENEQNKIVEEIERRFSIADEIEKVVDYSLKQSGRLKKSILKKAFEGKLVPQDPNDEPAGRLLEQIKAEKERVEFRQKTDLKLKTTKAKRR